MNSLRRKIIIALLSLVAFTGASILAVYVFEKRKAYVEKKRYERKKAYRGSSTMRKDAGKRAGKAVDAWKDQFKK